MASSHPDLVVMLLWPLLLILTLGREQSGVPPKAVILLQPPWSTTFKGETVNLICMDSHSPAQGATSWYHDQKLLEKVSEEIRIKTSGYYQCKTEGSSLSDPVHVEFSSDWLILQASYPVFEGDNVVLKCKAKEEKKASKKTYYKDGKLLHSGYNSDFITLNSISRDNGEYNCTASRHYFLGITRTITSNSLKIQVQELFLPPVLTANPSQATEGDPLTLTCQTQLVPQKSDVQLQFCFFRDGQLLGSSCHSSSELQIPTMWREDSGSYWCEAETVTHSITKRSLSSQIHVQRVPLSHVNLEIHPRQGQLIEGENLVLICSIAKGIGPITFSWHKEGTISLGRKTQHSLLTELQVPSVTERDAGRYYCAADRGDGPVLSRWIRVTVRSPVSLPVLTLRAPRNQTVMGDVVELHCGALRGSPPILYQFYQEDTILGNSSAPSGGGVSFNLSLTAEHSGNYSCEANNGLGPQRSQRVSLTVIVPVSRPVLTLRTPRAQAGVGDMAELHCEAMRGSPPILYQFYHEDVTLGSILALSGGGASFNLFLNSEHARNYSCEADNGLGAQRSEVMTLNATGLPRKRTGPIAASATGGVFGVLGLAATAALLHCFRTQKKSGGPSANGTASYSTNEGQETSLFRPSSIDPQEPTHSEQPTLMELQPVYNNEGRYESDTYSMAPSNNNNSITMAGTRVRGGDHMMRQEARVRGGALNPGDNNLVYSQVWGIQHTKEHSANSPRLPRESEEPVVIYSELKKAHSEDSAEQPLSRGKDYEDTEGNYENIPHASAASDH